MRRSRKVALDEKSPDPEDKDIVAPILNPLKEKENETTGLLDSAMLDDDDIEETQGLFCCGGQNKIFGLKVDTLVRMMKVCIAFPFVIVVSSLNLSNKYPFLK